MVLEDVDVINPAIISKIVPILRDRWVYVTENNQNVMRHDGMRVFMTARTHSYSRNLGVRSIVVDLDVGLQCDLNQ